MEKEAILKAAIEKAEKQGYELPENEDGNRDAWTVTLLGLTSTYSDDKSFQEIIFSHDFAKAFFGTERINKGKWFVGEKWQIHLRAMVLSPDHIKYLEQFLD